MSAPFTPGPWFAAVQLEPMGGCLSRLVMATDTGIAEVLFDDEDDPTAEANTRLIAAAPELYEALEAVTKFSRMAANGLVWSFADQPCAKQAFSALAKARGEQ